jgi:hypothetical protein
MSRGKDMDKRKAKRLYERRLMGFGMVFAVQTEPRPALAETRK